MNHSHIYPDMRRARKVRAKIEAIEDECGSRFYGLENITAKGVRSWSIAPHAPHVALEAIKGTGPASPPHIIKRYCTKRRAWRSVDLSTVYRITWTAPDGRKHEAEFL